jgi:acyl-CoA thioesterase FadM
MFADYCAPAVTASLNITYLKPIPPDALITVRVWLEKMEGRKKFMKGCILFFDENTHSMSDAIQAEALFVQPRV